MWLPKHDNANRLGIRPKHINFLHRKSLFSDLRLHVRESATLQNLYFEIKIVSTAQPKLQRIGLPYENDTQ